MHFFYFLRYLGCLISLANIFWSILNSHSLVFQPSYKSNVNNEKNTFVTTAQKKCFLLKLVPTTVLLVCFVYLKESTCEVTEDVFYFTSKLFSFLRSNFKFSDIQMSWRDVIKCVTWNTKHILLNNLGSKHSLVIKFGQVM